MCYLVASPFQKIYVQKVCTIKAILIQKKIPNSQLETP